MKIILFQPQIPQNTGNILRTCAGTKTGLIIVKPLGFSTSSRMMKRAGLNYQKDVHFHEIDHLEKYLENKNSFYFFSSKATTSYHKVSYTQDSHLIFGSETEGLPAYFFEKWPQHFVTIPMAEQFRCLNLSNAVAIGLYEALRQQDFEMKPV